MVRVELIELEMHFNNCVSLRSPVLGLLVSLGMYVELGQEGLDITLVFDGHTHILEVLIEDQLLVAASLAWWLSASSNY